MLVAIACAAASARRLWLVANATGLDPEVVLDRLGVSRTPAKKKTERAEPSDEERSRAQAAIDALREAIAKEPAAEWERDLLSALDTKDPDARAALVNEQLTELDWRIQRWARVPRVCASIATSFGFLLATLVLRRGLAEADLTGDVGELIVRGLVGDALTVAVFGIVGTAFCIAAQNSAKRLAKRRLDAADRLVEHLETYTSPGGRSGDPSRNPVLSG
jgi:hypothetical protein